MNKKTAATAIPTLAASPFVPVEVVDHENLSAADHEFLGKQEKVIEAGQKTFLEVGTALMKIRDYKNGLLCQRYGTFEAYCQERWEFGRAYGHRLISAVGRRPDLPDEARRLSMRIHLALTGPAGGDLTLHLDGGRLRVSPGAPRPPDATVTLRSETFVDLLAGRLDCTTAQLTGKLRVEGEGLAQFVVQGLVAMFRATVAGGGPAGFVTRQLDRWLARPRSA